MTTATPLTPQEAVERALQLSQADDCIVIIDEASDANLRWAANSLTTNGVMRSRRVTVIAIIAGTSGTAAGVVARSSVSAESLEPLLRAAEHAAREAGPAEDAQPLVGGSASRDWPEPPAETSIQIFGDFAPALGATLEEAQAAQQMLYGYVEHGIVTTYLGSSRGLRLRHVQPSGHVGITAKSADLARSAWVGQATRDFRDVDVSRLATELRLRLGWAERQVELPPGRYDSVLPPTAVADLMIYAYWKMGARDAQEGRTVYSSRGKGTRIGEQLAAPAVNLRSNPHYPGLECTPFVIARASSGTSSVFDNGLPVEATDWLRSGDLTSLIQTRHSADLTRQPTTPGIGNLILDVTSAAGSANDLVGDVERGLLLTCLWYIREVDPQTLLLTGLTRDGVYLIERGEVVGAVNNFRFNESPIALLGRVAAAGSTTATLSREWGDYFPRTAMPAIRVPDFNMSTASPAS